MIHSTEKETVMEPSRVPVGTIVYTLDDEDRQCPGVVARVRLTDAEPPDEDMVYVRWSATYFRWEYTDDLTPAGRRS